MKVLFLGYEDSPLIGMLKERGCEVAQTSEKITSTEGYDLVVSFGYRHILRARVIHSSPAPIINLHISYLPWNRGAHPNFWAHYEGTPSGVTIHLIDEGIDTGAILFQCYVNFADDETTFAATYDRLMREAIYLFSDNIEAILSGNYTPKLPRHAGTFHRMADLPVSFPGWDWEIDAALSTIDGCGPSQSV